MSDRQETLRLHRLWLDNNTAGVRADLSGAVLSGADLNWESHDLLAELLLRAAGADPLRRSLAGLVLVSRDWCWDKFLAVDHPAADWAKGVLRELGAPQLQAWVPGDAASARTGGEE